MKGACVFALACVLVTTWCRAAEPEAASPSFASHAADFVTEQAPPPPSENPPAADAPSAQTEQNATRSVRPGRVAAEYVGAIAGAALLFTGAYQATFALNPLRLGLGPPRTFIFGLEPYDFAVTIGLYLAAGVGAVVGAAVGAHFSHEAPMWLVPIALTTAAVVADVGASIALSSTLTRTGGSPAQTTVGSALILAPAFAAMLGEEFALQWRQPPGTRVTLAPMIGLGGVSGLAIAGNF